MKIKKIGFPQKHEEIQEFSEYTLGEEKCTISEGESILRDVKILGLYSVNGRTYLPEAVEKAKTLYEGAKVNVNHPKGDPLTPRDYQDRIGNIQKVVFKPGVGLFADFCFNPRHPLSEQFLWDASHAPRNVGFSHNIRAKTSVDKHGTIIVNEILEVRSVDIVADPATTSGIFESQHVDGKEFMESIQSDVANLRESLETLQDRFEEILRRSPAFQHPVSREQETPFEKSKTTFPDFLKKICQNEIRSN